MKHIRFSLAARAATLVLACGLYGTASAAIDNSIKLDAQSVVDKFNSMNGGQGMVFDYQRYRITPIFPISHRITPNQNYEFPDLSAYGTRGYFSTMRAASNITVNDNNNNSFSGTGSAILSYNPYRGITTAYDNVASSEITLSVGAAYLYTKWALEGKYGGPAMHNDYWKAEVQTANTNFANAWSILGNRDKIRLDTSGDKNLGLGLWNDSNPVLQDLLNINSSKSYWLAPYDPGKYYTEIGYYSVFVMNNRRPGNDSLMNMLYVANMNPVPEPETYAMMLAGLGLIGVIARRRRSKDQ